MSTKRKSAHCLSVCITNYNGERYLEESLGSIFAQKKKFDEILLVDNASDDRSLEIVREYFPAVKVIQLDQNRGPAAARNAAFKAAVSDRILFLDNDVSLGPDCSDHLLEALHDHPYAAVAMPRILYAHDRHTIQYDGAGCHFLGLMILHNANHPVETTNSRVKKINSLVTACFLVDRRRWGEGELFDDTFFFNYEDHDFGLRTRTMGHEILSVPSAHAFHREGTIGLSLRKGGTYSKVRVFCLIRNRWQIILKSYACRTLLLLAPLLFIYEIFQFAGVIKKGWLGQWLEAWLWTMLHIGPILRKRRIIQKARKTPDHEILQDGPIPFTDDLTKSPLEQVGKQCLDRLTEAYWRQVERFI
jgi:GT2 family glycosyltransferase